ncbi:hypothetical protein ADK38_21695 [Streptomyces varsoviensis]|uniref:Uncharacterized protein n=1 Tax=Streptomyces varsoviensis TaxID=67373 RepID=A0ABR5J3Y5_9ACTN|nr:hypothetical protein ADK38_21695 [Streptomyces varsoviensis]
MRGHPRPPTRRALWRTEWQRPRPARRAPRRASTPRRRRELRASRGRSRRTRRSPRTLRGHPRSPARRAS